MQKGAVVLVHAMKEYGGLYI